MEFVRHLVSTCIGQFHLCQQKKRGKNTEKQSAYLIVHILFPQSKVSKHQHMLFFPFLTWTKRQSK